MKNKLRQLSIILALLANYCVIVPLCVNSPNFFIVLLGGGFALAGAILAYYFITFGR